jgi:hypothetical protein
VFAIDLTGRMNHLLVVQAFFSRRQVHRLRVCSDKIIKDELTGNHAGAFEEELKIREPKRITCGTGEF